ncbi:MAG: ASCH domain-containing protein [Clostridiales bacterium]|nr:ASCH domain-containing protein [Clostridiales bacterium]
MNLAPQPFEAIAEGKKTVEMRLNDERRATLRVGDGIEFENIETLDKVVCKVVNITRFNDFFELYSHFDKTLIGYSESEIADPADMYQNYTAEKIAQYGVLAIEIILI